jgi:hypothetical protein
LSEGEAKEPIARYATFTQQRNTQRNPESNIVIPKLLTLGFFVNLYSWLS